MPLALDVCLAASHVSSLHGRPILAAWIASKQPAGSTGFCHGPLAKECGFMPLQLKVTLSVPVHGEQMNEMPYTSMNSRAISLHFPYCAPNCWWFGPVYQLGSQSLRGIWCHVRGLAPPSPATTRFPSCSQGATLGQCWNAEVPRHGLVTQVVVRRRYGSGGGSGGVGV